MDAKFIKFSIDAGGTPSNDFKDNLVAYWALDEASGTFEDSHGVHDSTTEGAGITYGSTGKLGDAVTFDGGSTSYIEFDTSSAVEIQEGSDVSMCAWIYPTAYPDIGDQGGVIGGEAAAAWFGIFHTDGRLTFGRVSGSSTSQSTLLAPLNQWSFIAASYDNSETTSNVILYLNGSSTTVNLDVNFVTGQYINVVGADRTSRGFGMVGIVDDCAVWLGRILTTDEMDDIYNSGDGLAYSSWGSS